MAVMGYNPSYFSHDGKGKAGLKPSDYSNKPTGGRNMIPADTSNFPVENVSWEEAKDFCEKLTKKENNERLYRLPTEAEWEYSCRGGANSYQVFHYGNSLSSSQANFNGRYPYGNAVRGRYLERTSEVGGYKKNNFGLYDMHGNVWEWCSDWYGNDYYRKSPRRDPQGPSEGSHRVSRGGCWWNFGSSCRSAARIRRALSHRDYYIGFRVVCVPSVK
jgi:formylglycine-generating enzyme required for sulfatase activity